MKNRSLTYGLILLLTALHIAVQANDELFKKPFLTSYHAFTTVNDLIVVQAKLSGKTGNYIFDTGSTGLVLNTSEEGNKTTKVEVSGACSPNSAYAKEVDRFEFGGISKYRFQATCMSLKHIEESMNMPISGLLGMDILHGAAISIDYAAQVITLSDPNVSMRTADVELDLSFHHGIPMVHSTMEGSPLHLAIDFGASSSMVNKTVADQHQLETVEQIDLLTAGGKTEALDKVRCDNLILGDSFAFETDAIVTDLDHLQSDDFAIDGVIGLDLLRYGKVMLNPSQGKLYIWFTN